MICLAGCTEKPAQPLSSKSFPTDLVTLLEQRESHLDQTLWKREILALRCERVFNQVWDSLRAGAKLSSEIRKFDRTTFTEVLPGEATNHAHEIKEISLRSGNAGLSAGSFAERVQQWEDQGYQIELSDWRQPEFHFADNEASSVFNVSLYISNKDKPGRWFIRGQLLMTWDFQSLEGEKPLIKTCSFGDLHLFSRDSAPLFKLAAQQEFSLPPGLETLDANLMVQDLNRDGLPEIMIGNANLLLWNKGSRFTPDDLFVDPRIKAFATLLADFDKDGVRDLLVASPDGVWLLKGTTGGNFPKAELAWKPSEPMLNPFVMTCGDLNGDDAPEVWLAQYKLPFVEGQMPTPFYNANDGFPSYLLQNDGAGKFTDRTTESNLAAKRFRRTYSASFVDLDGDVDLDLLVVSDFYGIDIFQNQGKGVFLDVTSSWVADPHAFGMAHAVTDLDRNQFPDLLIVGMTSDAAARLDQWQGVRPGYEQDRSFRHLMTSGNKLLQGSGGRWSLDNRSRQLNLAGWAWGVTCFDFDNDSNLDIYMVNGHISRGTTADYESEFWRHDIYVGTSEHLPVHDQYFRRKANLLGELSYGGFWKNAFFLNNHGRSFLETGWLFDLAEEKDCRDVVSADLNQDGKLDLVFTSFEHWPRLRQMLHIYLNQASGGNWIAFDLEEGNGTSLPGAKAVITLPGGNTQTRWIVNGDSYHSQHPATAHFGLGSSTTVEKLELFYPNGKRKEFLTPAINRSHLITPD